MISVKYEKAVAEDLELGRGEVTRTMPGGGTAVGNKIGTHTFASQAFAASLGSAQSITGSLSTLVDLDTEDMDTEGWYDPGGAVFQPDVAGVYLISAQLSLAAFSGLLTVTLLRGATEVARVDAQRTAAVATIGFATVVAMNGTTDTLTLKVEHSDSSSRNVTSAYMSGTLLGNA